MRISATPPFTDESQASLLPLVEPVASALPLPVTEHETQAAITVRPG